MFECLFLALKANNQLPLTIAVFGISTAQQPDLHGKSRARAQENRDNVLHVRYCKGTSSFSPASEAATTAGRCDGYRSMYKLHIAPRPSRGCCMITWTLTLVTMLPIRVHRMSRSRRSSIGSHIYCIKIGQSDPWPRTQCELLAWPRMIFCLLHAVGASDNACHLYAWAKIPVMGWLNQRILP